MGKCKGRFVFIKFLFYLREKNSVFGKENRRKRVIYILYRDTAAQL
jgi:hypothetical protein